MKKSRILGVLAALMVMMAFPLTAQAAAGGKVVGAKLPNYSKVVEITVDDNRVDSKGRPIVKGENFSYNLREALRTAEKKASSSTQYKIIIKPGKYKMLWAHRIISNTHIYAVGATVERYGPCCWSTDPDKKVNNVILEGGTWITKNDNRYKEIAAFRFAHVKNLVMKDMKITSKRKSHIVEVGDMNGFTVSNCTISGNYKSAGVQPKEAIQLDVASSGAMVGLTPYNGKGCHNVIVENCTFSNVARGVGSHNNKNQSKEKNPYTNVTIRNNTFTKIAGEAIFATWWKNCNITGNKITNGKHAGIYVDNSSYVKIQKNTMKKIKAYTGARKTQYGKDVAGVLLRFSSRNNIRNNTISGSKGKAVLQTGTCKKNTVKGNKKK